VREAGVSECDCPRQVDELVDLLHVHSQELVGSRAALGFLPGRSARSRARWGFWCCPYEVRGVRLGVPAAGLRDLDPFEHEEQNLLDCRSIAGGAQRNLPGQTAARGVQLRKRWQSSEVRCCLDLAELCESFDQDEWIVAL